jgi:hypothetical protein
MEHAWDRMAKATTLNEFRKEIIEVLRVRAWEETAFMDRLVKTKKGREARQHAARSLEILANYVESVEIAHARAAGLTEKPQQKTCDWRCPNCCREYFGDDSVEVKAEFDAHPNHQCFEDCPGDVDPHPERGDDPSVFDFCKTARKPYDLIVCGALIVAAKHASEYVKVSSDGEVSDWRPALKWVKSVLGQDYDIPLAEDKTHAM